MVDESTRVGKEWRMGDGGWRILETDGDELRGNF
jgi:hypothetical protein